MYQQGWDCGLGQGDSQHFSLSRPEQSPPCSDLSAPSQINQSKNHLPLLPFPHRAAAELGTWCGSENECMERKERVKEEATGREGEKRGRSDGGITAKTAGKRKQALKSQIKIAARRTQVCSTWE